MLTAVKTWPSWPNLPALFGAASAARPPSFETFVKKIETLDLEPRILELMQRKLRETPSSAWKGVLLSSLGLATPEQRLEFARSVEKAFGITFGTNTRDYITRNCTLEYVYKRTRLFYTTQRA